LVVVRHRAVSVVAVRRENSAVASASQGQTAAVPPGRSPHVCNRTSRQRRSRHCIRPDHADQPV